MSSSLMKKTKNFVLFDMSYILFWKYFGIISYYKRQKNQDGILIKINEINQDDFIGKFVESIKNYFKNMSKVFPVEKYKWVVAKDTPRNHIWRNEIHNNYKGTRDQKGNKEFLSESFKKFWVDIFKEIRNIYNITLLEISGCEADDVIGMFVKKLKTDSPYSKNSKCYIIASDHDYIQLKKYDHVYIHDRRSLSSQDEINKINDISHIYSSYVIQNFVVFKAFLGDKSDNIDGVSRLHLSPNSESKIKKTMKPRAITKAMLTKYLESGPNTLLAMLDFDNNLEAKQQYLKNKKLIDFDEIPSHYKSEFDKLYNELFV